MAQCLTLQDFSVESEGGSCVVTLQCWNLHPVEWFERILCRAFPASAFVREGDPQDSGLLGFEKVVRLRGSVPASGVEEVGDFLSLLNSTLTIEDLLDESHALGYHQDEDAAGGLVRSALGNLVFRAKYNRPPDEAARTKVLSAMRRFIERHPRYALADVLAAIPPHDKGTQQSLCRRMTAELVHEFGCREVKIVRRSSTPPQKDISDEDRTRGVERRIANQKGSMKVDDNLDGELVVVLDDLYGSGGSMLEAARALKESGASEVLGLAITKQRLFEGVRMATQD